MNIRQTRQHGFSLVELLIAMALGLILIAGMIAVFSGNKRSSELTSEMANMQESARFALQTMSNDLRAAGFQGCLRLDHGSLIDITLQQIVGENGIYESAATGSVVVDALNWQPQPVDNYIPPAGITAVVGTHTLAMRGGTDNRVSLRFAMTNGVNPNGNAPLVLEQDQNFMADPGEPAIASDCNSAHLFIISGKQMVDDSWVLTHTFQGNEDGGRFHVPYGTENKKNATDTNHKLKQATVTPYFSNLYFVGTTGDVTENGDLITSLYQQSYPFDSVTNPPTALIQGIENMRVAFGIKDKNGRIQYVQADDPIYDPTAVVSVQVGLLMSSWDQIAAIEDKNTYVLAGQPIVASASSADGYTHAEDTRFRLAFNTTIKVRNRKVQKQ